MERDAPPYERVNFQRVYDLTERVIPEHWRKDALSRNDALERLLLLGLQGHGWATTGTLSQTWRLSNMGESIRAALVRLRKKGAIVACSLVDDDGRHIPGWVRPQDFDKRHNIGWAIVALPSASTPHRR